MKNVAYLEEIKIAFANVSELKVDMDNVFDMYKAHWDQLSEKEQNVVKIFEERYNCELIKRPRGGKFHYFESLKLAYQDRLEDCEFDFDATAGVGWQAYVDLSELDGCEETDMKHRKKFIVDCAQFKEKIIAFKSEFLEALNQVQEKSAQIAAPEVKTTKEVNTQLSFTYRIKKTVQKICATVKNTVNNVIRTVKTSIENMVVCMKRTVAAIIA